MKALDLDIKVVIDDTTGRASVSSDWQGFEAASAGELITDLYAQLMGERIAHSETRLRLAVSPALLDKVRGDKARLRTQLQRETRRKDALLRRILNDGPRLGEEHLEALRQELGGR